MTKLIVMLGFVVAFSAGLLTGWQTSRPERGHGVGPPSTGPSTRQGGPMRGRGFLPRELNLTAEQQKQMDEIWSSMAAHGPREQDERRREFRQERDDAIVALIRPEDRAAYEQILKTYTDRMSAMDQETRKAFEDAVRRTKEILTSEQQAKYEEILKRFQPGERGPRGRGPGRGGDRSPGAFDEGNRRAGPDRATSRPADK